MHRFLWALIMMFGLATPAMVYAADVPAETIQAREELANWMKDTTVAVLQDQSKSYEARARNLKNSFTKVVDIDWIAKFVLGANWRKADEAQRAEYVELYRQFLLKTYVETYGQSRDRKIVDIALLGLVHDDDKFTARTELKLSSGEQLHVDYLVAEKEDTKKIVDIVIENVSLLNTHRAEFGKIASSKGMDGVIDTLHAKLGNVKVADAAQ